MLMARSKDRLNAQSATALLGVTGSYRTSVARLARICFTEVVYSSGSSRVGVPAVRYAEILLIMVEVGKAMEIFIHL